MEVSQVYWGAILSIWAKTKPQYTFITEIYHLVVMEVSQVYCGAMLSILAKTEPQYTFIAEIYHLVVMEVSQVYCGCHVDYLIKNRTTLYFYSRDIPSCSDGSFPGILWVPCWVFGQNRTTLYFYSRDLPSCVDGSHYRNQQQFIDSILESQTGRVYQQHSIMQIITNGWGGRQWHCWRNTVSYKRLILKVMWDLSSYFI